MTQTTVDEQQTSEDGKAAYSMDDTSAEISDIDHRLNQLQDFLRQAKLDASVTATPSADA
jgi:hypothetical protein